MLSTKRWFKFDVIEHKGPLISSLVQNHGRWFACTVARLDINADQYGRWPALLALEFCDELVRMRRYHPVVVIGGGHHGRRIGRFGLDIVDRRIAP